MNRDSLDLEVRLFSTALNNTAGTICAFPLLLILRALLLSGLYGSPEANFTLGIVYGVSVAWNLGLWAAWFVASQSIKKEAQ